METNSISKWGLVGHQFSVAGVNAKLTGWHSPELLRAGDLIHVDAQALSVVASLKKHRGGTMLIGLSDGREICVCGATEIATFAAV